MSGSKKTYRHIVFDLWISRFAITFDQLLEDGYCQETVLDYYANNANDIGFIWRSSYADHCRKIKMPKKATVYGYQSFAYTIYNLLTVISLILKVLIKGEGLYSTRPLKKYEYLPLLSNEPTYVKILTDFLRFPIRFSDSQNKKGRCLHLPFFMQIFIYVVIIIGTLHATSEVYNMPFQISFYDVIITS